MEQPTLDGLTELELGPVRPVATLRQRLEQASVIQDASIVDIHLAIFADWLDEQADAYNGDATFPGAVIERLLRGLAREAIQ